jgi:cellulose biosynthesis protein BcsQ
MPTVVFANRKGGVGKTLSTLYTGRWLARQGRDVTLVDLDPQQGLWDIAALMGCPDGVLTKRLRLAPQGSLPRPDAAQGWVLIDTPPALDGIMPSLREAEYLVVPCVPELQEVQALAKFLAMLDATKPDRPFTRTLGVLPVRYAKHWPAHRSCLASMQQLAERHGLALLQPVPHSTAVHRYSLAGGLWKQLASLLIQLEPTPGVARAA